MKTVSLSHAARVLGVTHRSVTLAVKRGDLSPVAYTDSGRAQFSLDDILAYQSRTQSAALPADHLSLSEAAIEMGISRQAVSALVKSRGIEVFHLNQRVKCIARSDFEKLAASRKQGSRKPNKPPQ